MMTVGMKEQQAGIDIDTADGTVVPAKAREVSRRAG
jgi:hypothetical protein